MFWWAAGKDVPNGMVKWVMSEVIICQDEALTDRVMGKQKLLYILHSCVGVQKNSRRLQRGKSVLKAQVSCLWLGNQMMASKKPAPLTPPCGKTDTKTDISPSF